jgi:hypothetical protein
MFNGGTHPEAVRKFLGAKLPRHRDPDKGRSAWSRGLPKSKAEPSTPYAVARTRKGMALPVMVAPAARDAVIASLSELLGDRLSTGELVRRQHGRDASYHPCVPPDAVAFVQSTE